MFKRWKKTDVSRDFRSRSWKVIKTSSCSATSSAGKLGRFKPGCVKHSPHARRKLALHRWHHHICCMEPVNKRRRDRWGAAAEPEVRAGRGQDAALTSQHDCNRLKTEPRKYEWIVLMILTFSYWPFMAATFTMPEGQLTGMGVFHFNYIMVTLEG